MVEQRKGFEAPIESALRRKVGGGFVAAVLVTLFVGAWSWQSARRAEADAYWVSHTYEVMATIQGMSGAALEAETSAQAFALSGQEPLLMHYPTARAIAYRDEDVLRRLTADNQSQQRRLEVLEPKLRAAFEISDNIIAKRRQMGTRIDDSDALEVEGSLVWMRAIFGDMQAEEARLLEQRTQRDESGQQWARIVAVAALVVGLVLWTLAFVVVILSTGDSQRSRAELENLNAELEKRVEDRTAALRLEIADRRRTQEIAERLAAVVESSDDAIISKTLGGTITAWNRGAEKVFGYSSVEAVGKPMTILLPSDRIGEESDILARISRGESVNHYETVRVRKDGSKINVSVTISPIRDSAGVITGASKIARDITEHKAAEREIRALNQNLEARVIERTAELKAANKELEAFTYSVSHDLRAPIRHISGFTKILVEKFNSSLPDEAQQHLQTVERAARRMGQMVDEMLKLARLGRQALEFEVANLNLLVTDVVNLLAPEIEGRQVQWKIDDLPSIECDRILIRQVFQNLIGNALKYSRTRSPAAIEIGQMEKEGESVIFVRDNGVGFDMRYADKLFGVFQRLHLAEEFEGTGIGLATVERIIKKHRGSVWAEAEPNRGATFYFTLGGARHSRPESTAAAAAGGLR